MESNTDVLQNLKTELELHTETIIKDEVITEEDAYSPQPIDEEKPGTADTCPDTVTDPEEINDQMENAIPNIIFLGSRIPNSGTVDEDGNNDAADEKESGTVNVEGKSGNNGGKNKGKRRLKTELELLGIDVNGEANASSDGHDGFRVDSKVFRKYKLRKTEQISYKEPADIKPRRYSSDDDDDMTCPKCQREFENRVALQNHLRTHKQSVPKYICSICFKTFTKNEDLISHKQEHSMESFLCTQCKLAFSNYYDYLLHNYQHLKQAYFKCMECGLLYRKSMYKNHIQTHFDRKLSCDICSFVAKGEKSLRAHKTQHSVNGNYTCEECGKVFKWKVHYDYHMGFHTGVKTVQCLYCGACFRDKGMRNIHTRIHTGEKPYSCDICGHRASQKTDIQRHKLTHIREKKYACDLCGKKYIHKDYLVIHMRSHTKSSLYECSECDGKFVSVNGLKTHTLFKHTSERPVECTLCDKKFINNNQYRKHCRAKYHLNNVYGVNMSK